MATSTLGDLTEAIPLLDDNGSGVYNKGRNTARDFRMDFIAGLFGVGSISTRPGVLANFWTGNATTGYFVELRGTAQGTPSRVITVGAGRAFCSRSGQGPYVMTLETDLNVTMPAADGSLPRIDRVYVLTYDKGSFGSDPDHGPKVIVETGTPNASPIAPSIPSEAVPIFDVYRRAGSSGDQIAQGDITDKRKGTSLSGTPRPMLGGDSLATVGTKHGEQRLRAGNTFVPSGLPVTHLIDTWSAIDGKWHGTQSMIFTARLTAPGTINNGATRIGSQIVLPDPGWEYKVSGAGHNRLTVSGSPGPNLATAHIRVGNTAAPTAHDGTVVAVGVCQAFGSGGYFPIEFGTADNVFSGSQTVYKLVTNNTGATATLVGSTDTFDTFTVIMDPA
jgi:hypothetical protein